MLQLGFLLALINPPVVNLWSCQYGGLCSSVNISSLAVSGCRGDMHVSAEGCAMCVCVRVCAERAGVERILQRRIEFLYPEMPATHICRRSDTETVGTQTLHTITHAHTGMPAHTHRKYADSTDTHVDRYSDSTQATAMHL